MRPFVRAALRQRQRDLAPLLASGQGLICINEVACNIGALYRLPEHGRRVLPLLSDIHANSEALTLASAMPTSGVNAGVSRAILSLRGESGVRTVVRYAAGAVALKGNRRECRV
jgi:hypothetical protein